MSDRASVKKLAPDDLLFTQEEQGQAARLTAAFVDSYYKSLRERPVFPALARKSLRTLMAEPMPCKPQPLELLFSELKDIVLANATHTSHPRFLSYVLSSPNGIDAYAAHIAAVLNQNCCLWRLSPIGSAVELTLTRWFCDLFGLPESSGGIVVSGGSAANLLGLAAGRDAFLGEKAGQTGLQQRHAPLCVYVSDEIHASVDKSIRFLGIGEDHMRRIPTDAALRMIPAALERAIAEDRAASKAPFCVVASAGTVMTGAIDPIAQLAAICKREGLWLHVDGAYGGFCILSERYAKAMADVRLADSISLDPHKFLFSSLEAGCIILRDKSHLRHSFGAQPSYLGMDDDADFCDFANYGPQLSRAFKAFKVWWALKHFGSAAFARAIERMCDLAVYMGNEIERRHGLELLAPVRLNCVCLRLGDMDESGNRAVLRKLVEEGIAFLGPARVKGCFGMRACFMNLRTRKSDIDLILDYLEKAVP